MAVTYNQYRYTLEFRYVYNKIEYAIAADQIHYVTVDYSYEDKFGPVMVLKAAIDRNHLDYIISTSGKETMSVIIRKHILDQDPRIDEDYVNKKLIYFTDETMNENKDMDYAEDREDIFKIASIGFVDQDSMNGCKMNINEVLRNVRLADVLAYYLTINHNLLMEPPRDINIPLRIVTPLTTITQLVAYLDDVYGIYDGRYTLFFDYDMAYLISKKGNKIQSKKERMSSVVINVGLQGTQLESNLQGLGIDQEQKVYVMEIDASNVEPYEEKATNAIINQIQVVDRLGGVASQTIAQPTVGVIPKSIVDRKSIGDIGQQANRDRNVMDMNTFVVHISKTDIDTSVFTVNKEYTIKNYDKSDTSTVGKFMLSRKREMYVKEDKNLILTTVLTFKKVP
jgi:hypothetical protein